MVCRTAIISALAALAAAHGTVTQIKGANGVVMPGLTIVDGTFRTVQQNLFGQTDTALMDDSDSNGPLGVNDAGPVDPTGNVLIFMGEKKAPKIEPPLIPLDGERERIVTETAGKGARSGLPTPDRNGILSMTWHQVNADGAGPLSASLDMTSAGTKLEAFRSVPMVKDVPGSNGESDAVLVDFPITVQVPRNTRCSGRMGKLNNVCVLRVTSPAGPWGGAVAFTMPNQNTKRSTDDRMSRLRIARALHLVD